MVDGGRLDKRGCELYANAILDRFAELKLSDAATAVLEALPVAKY